MSAKASFARTFFVSGLKEALEWPVFSWLRVAYPVRLFSPDGSVCIIQGALRLPDRASVKPVATAVLLPEECLLFRDLELPGLPEEMLYAALALEIERISPFSAADLRWGWSIVRREDDRVHVRLALGARQAVQRHLRMLGLDEADAGLEIWAADTPPLVLGGFAEKVRHSREKRGTVVASLLLCTVIAGFFFLAMIPFLQTRAVVLEAQKHFQQLEQETLEVRASRDRVHALQVVDRVIRESAPPRTEVLDVLELLARELPDTAHLQLFEQRGDVVRVTGIGLGASSLVNRLAGHQRIGGLRTTGAITRVGDKGEEQFSVEFRLLPALHEEQEE
jgi:general secretion pathway protein L